jgi:glycosyltransferase involved in cell wall biosynthesis
MSHAAVPHRRAGQTRPVILTFLRHYLPGFRAGGPIRSIANLVEAIGDEFEFRIVTLDRDHGQSQSYSGIAPFRWTRVRSAWVMYVEPAGFGLRKLAAIARQTPHNLVYLNSFFDPRFTQQVLVARRLRLLPQCPLLIAPRGELAQGALQIKQLRKNAFIAVSRLARLHKGATWQATSPAESIDIKRRVHDADGRIFVVPNVTSISAGPNQPEGMLRAPGAPLRVCFLSRISKKKNLAYALGVLARVNVRVHFTIYGPIEDAQYWSECTSSMAKLPPHIIAVYGGELPHSNVQASLARQDVFFLPTRNENFGHAIWEALSAGLVVVTSDQTPWCDLEAHGAGWALSLGTEEGFVQVLEELASWDFERFRTARAAAQAYAAEVANLEERSAASRDMFRRVIEAAR